MIREPYMREGFGIGVTKMDAPANMRLEPIKRGDLDGDGRPVPEDKERGDDESNP